MTRRQHSTPALWVQTKTEDGFPYLKACCECSQECREEIEGLLKIGGRINPDQAFFRKKGLVVSVRKKGYKNYKKERIHHDEED